MPLGRRNCKFQLEHGIRRRKEKKEKEQGIHSNNTVSDTMNAKTTK